MTLEDSDFSFYVRATTHDDLGSVMSINEATLPENYPLFFYEDILEKYPNSFLVGCLNAGGSEKVVGYIMWRLERGISEFGVKIVKKGHLVSLAVLDAYRRNGIAAQMLAKGMHAIYAYGAREFVLEVRVSNVPAYNLYSNKFGFEKKKVIPQYYRDGEDANFMAANRLPPLVD
ncbi:MAG TPA: N-acetyltransferase [Candidatus Lokiarchaeia archaeon]|nr:N-acetyltransferase [Candidatus Lokiarchaeia archaeon]